MICYPEDATEEEISVINDYWLMSDESPTGFLYTVEKINNYYKPKNTRSAIGLAKKSRFFLPRSAFFCQDCSRKSPVESRKGYADRIKSEVPTICSACSELKRQRLIDDAYRTLNDYKVKKFEPIICLDSLTIEETLVLLSISSENSGNDNYLGESPAEISVTGAQLVDDNLLNALIDKRALIYIWEIPLDVEKANTVIYGDVSRIKYDTKFENTRRYRHARSVTCGLYLNNKTSAGYIEVSELSSFLYQKLYSATWSINDVANVHQIIKEVQIEKLYKLVMEISGEYKLSIDNSNVLRALLNHLAENYPPQNLYFTFRTKAREVIIYMHKDEGAARGYRAKHYFAKFVGDYIAYVESRGFDLKKHGISRRTCKHRLSKLFFPSYIWAGILIGTSCRQRRSSRSGSKMSACRRTPKSH